MSSPLAFGLIGAGWIGSFHAETLASRLPNTRLAAVADPVPGAAEKFSGARAYQDPLALIADPDVHAVAICSPRPAMPTWWSRPPGPASTCSARSRWL